jgi:transketolase
MLTTTVQVRDLLAANGRSSWVLSMHTLKPLDVDTIRQVAKTNLIVTIEEHAATGGLGSAVSEVLAAGADSYPSLLMLNAGTRYETAIGSQGYLRELLGLDAAGIAGVILSRLNSSER